jgi:excisionase family DNA binding protein
MAMTRPQELNLKQTAAQLGVHYMTAYRYIRTGRLLARKVGTGWVIDPADLQQFSTSPKNIELSEQEPSAGADWKERLRRTLVIGDEMAAWRVIEQALSAGHSPTECYLDLIVGAINDISERSQAPPREPVAGEYLATATATRLVARLGARFRRPGRSRGTIVFGAPIGEHHVLAISVVADLVRLDGFTCLELGANVPAEAFAGAARDAYRLVAVGIGVTTSTNLDKLEATIDAVHAVDSEIPIVLGGQAGGDPLLAAGIGATSWATDGLHAIEVFNQLASKRRVLWLEHRDTDDAGESDDLSA